MDRRIKHHEDIIKYRQKLIMCGQGSVKLHHEEIERSQKRIKELKQSRMIKHETTTTQRTAPTHR